MTIRSTRAKFLALGASGIAISLALAGCASNSGGGGGGGEGEGAEISYLVDNQESTTIVAEALIKEFESQNPDIKVELETRPQGADGDNLIKTRLATGEMNSVFAYNSGSLLQALNPDQTLVNLDDQKWV